MLPLSLGETIRSIRNHLWADRQPGRLPIWFLQENEGNFEFGCYCCWGIVRGWLDHIFKIPFMFFKSKKACVIFSKIASMFCIFASWSFVYQRRKTWCHLPTWSHYFCQFSLWIEGRQKFVEDNRKLVRWANMPTRSFNKKYRNNVACLLFSN